MISQQEFRANVLASYGGSASVIEELIEYNHNVFDTSRLTVPLKFPLPPEPHVPVWEEYANTAKDVGTFKALKQVLVQFQFPIQENISQTESYRAATRKGVLVNNMTEATGLVLDNPKQLQLIVHQSPAGAIPVLSTENRADFVTLVQALTMQNEPRLVPASMGACIVAGFNNWDRIQRYRKQWEAQNSRTCTETDWITEFGRLIPQKHLYQDKFIILSGGCYSNVSASDLGLEEREWQSLSLTIRLEHECTHYFTRRLFSSMRNNLLDELIADYRGIVAACGYYRADWFLRFMGLESFPNYREGGRLQNYRGKPPLSDGAFRVLQALVKDATENLQNFDMEFKTEFKTDCGQISILLALICLTLEELASNEASSRIRQTVERSLAVSNI